MTKRDAARAIRKWLWKHVTEKKGFVDRGASIESDDEAAMVHANCTASPVADRITVLFRCASSLDPSQPPVTDWMEECIAAVRAALPEETAVAELVPTCIRKNDADGGLKL